MSTVKKLELKLKVKTEHSERLTKKLSQYLNYEGPIKTHEEAQAALLVRNELDTEISEIKSKLNI